MSSDGSGHIELIVGPMFAGKTTELIRRVRRELFARRACYVVKHARDVRYSCENVSSHDKALLSSTAAVSELSAVGDAWRDYDVVAVDEGQFFPDLVDFCTTAADAGKKVIVSALDGDYRRQPFDGVCRLIPLAESVKKLSAVCMECHSRAAAFTYRTVRSSQRELIGGADMYIAACRACFLAKERQDGEAAERQAAGEGSPAVDAARKRTERESAPEERPAQKVRHESPRAEAPTAARSETVPID